MPEPISLPVATDPEDGSHTLTSTKKKKKNKNKRLARTNSISEQNGNGDPSIQDVISSPKSSTLDSTLDETLEDASSCAVQHPVSTETVVETIVLDPNGDVTLVVDISEQEAAGADQDETEGARLYNNVHEASPDTRHVRHLRASSAHLALASPLLKNTIDAARPAGEPLRIYLEGDDEHAALLVLRVLHHQDLYVPREISLDLLSKVAAFVGKYDMAKSTSFVVRSWVAALAQLPLGDDEFGPDSIKTLFISWVFGLRDEFKHASGIAIRLCPRRLDDHDYDGFPVFEFPQSLVDAIDEKRQAAVKVLLDKYRTATDLYYGDDDSDATQCVHQLSICDQNVLGALVRTGRRAHLDPPPAAPYVGLSFQNTLDTLNRIEFSRCPCSASKASRYSACSCSPGQAFRDAVAETDLSLVGDLNLEDFLSDTNQDLLKMPVFKGLPKQEVHPGESDTDRDQGEWM